MAVETRPDQPTLEPGEVLIPPPPTTLHLFRFKDVELPGVKQMIENATELRHRFSLTIRYNERLAEELKTRVERLNAFMNDLRVQNRDLLSSRSASWAYLKMYDELSQRGVSEDQIMDFYNMCLAINTDFSTQIEAGQIKTFGISVNLVNRGEVDQRYTVLVSKRLEEPPSWFGNNRQRWKLFVGERGNFTRYLNQDLIAKYGSNIPKEELTDKIRSTFKDALPDWLTEGVELSNRSTVEEELGEDTKEAEAIKQHDERTRRHFEYTKASAEQKTLRLIQWGIRGLDKVFLKDRLNFYQSLIFLNFSRGFPSLDADDLSEINIQKIQKVQTKKIDPDRAHELRILSFAQHGAITSKEIIALWLEDHLKTAGIMDSTQKTIDRRTVTIFNLLFAEAANMSGEIGNQWRELRDNQDPVFAPLNYDVKPLLALLSADNLSYLQNLARDSQYRAPLEMLVWEMADLIAQNTETIEDFADTDKPLKKALSNFRDFAKKWLRKNWQWVYEELVKVSSGQTQRNKFFAAQIEPQLIYQEEETVPEVEEVKGAIEEIRQGNLAGWHLFYSKRMVTDKDALTQIPGKTLEEQEKSLGEFLLANNISCSIGSSSVIRTLEWLTTVPQEVEQIRIKKRIGGVDFKKLKRGAVRIFYDMDQTKKEIVFFVHQKKAWKYSF